MADYLDLSAGAMVDVIESWMGWSSPTAANSAFALECLNFGYRRVLRGFSPLSRRTKSWACLQPAATLAVPADQSTCNATGTYSGTTELTTVTAAASKFYPWVVGRTITLSTEGEMTVYAYTSATVVTVQGDHSWTGNETLTVPHSGVVTLPDDFGGLVNPPEYIQPISGAGLPALGETSHDQLMQVHREHPAQQDPWNFAIVPATFAAATGQRWEMWFAPTPDEDRLISYRYRVRAVALTDSGTVYPVGGTDLCDLIVQAAKAEAEKRRKPGGANHPEEDYYRVLMEEALDADVARMDESESVVQMDQDTGIGV